MTRILIILRTLWTAGAQRIAINEYRWLKKLGYEPKLIFLRGTNTKGYEEMLKDIDYKVIREGHGIFTPIFYVGTKMFARDRGIESTVDLDLIMKISGIAKEEKADYLICHDQFTAIGCLKAFERNKIPFSVFVHEKVTNYSLPILGKIINDLEKKIFVKAKKVFAVTDKVARTIYEKHGINAISNYPGMDKISEKSFREKENYLITVSFWDLGRKPWDYVEVIKNVDDYKLLFVGNWRVKKAKEYFFKKVKEEGIESKVEMLEGVSESKLHELYDKSKFLIRFGYGEYGLATPFIEAMQHTLPVIINDELGTADLAKRYNVGLVIHGINIKEIKEFLKNMNENKYKELQLGIAKIQKEYTWENHTKKLVEGIT